MTNLIRNVQCNWLAFSHLPYVNVKSNKTFFSYNLTWLVFLKTLVTHKEHLCLTCNKETLQFILVHVKDDLYK